MRLIDETLARITPRNTEYRALAAAHIHQLTMPRRALGRLLDLAEDLAGMREQTAPSVARKNIIVMAGDHGIVAEGVSDQPQEVTAQMVRNFAAGGGGICVLADNAGARVTLVDIGVKCSDFSDLPTVVKRKIAPGTENFARGPAMTREQAIRSIETGVAVIHELDAETDVFGTGEMGIGNTSPSSAIAAVLTGRPLEELVGRGAGLPPEKLSRKLNAIRRGLELNRPDPNDPIDILSKVGGYEIGGIAGLCLGAAARRKPIVIDGFISTAGALLAAKLSPAAADYMIPAHMSREPGHRHLLEMLDRAPLLDLELRLGEGSGAALAMHLLDAAHAIMTRMATFDSAGVTSKGL
jgi:nicotinate-nucleotide--dimethylbenzimidazole phosphoribosyltransferase